MVGNKVGGVIGLLLVAGLLAAPAGADEPTTWPVKHRLWGTDGGKSTDVSGIACTTAAGFPRSCLVIDDNSQSAQLVTLEDGKINAGEQVELISNKFKKKALELDGEGVAFAAAFRRRCHHPLLRHHDADRGDGPAVHAEAGTGAGAGSARANHGRRRPARCASRSRAFPSHSRAA